MAAANKKPAVKPAVKLAAKPALKSVKKAATTPKATTNEIIMIPLSKLIASEKNTRKEGDKKRDVSGMVASIRAEGGILHNLIVHEDHDAKGKHTGKYKVADGEGRRLAELELVDQGEHDKNILIPCKVVPEDRATGASLSANFRREDMHPADLFAAFQRLVDENKSIGEIATSYAMPEKKVAQLLKLANVSPALLIIFRNGGIKLEQLMALAITDDHKAQESIWKDNGPDATPARLRTLLTSNEVDSSENPMAQFVGIDAYTAAGGKVRKDLFSESGQFYLSDSGLLLQLAEKQLTAAAEKLKVEGFAWTQIMPEFDHAILHQFSTAKTTGGEPSKRQKTRITQLERELNSLDEQYEDTSDWTIANELDAQRDAIRDEIREIAEISRTIAPEHAAIMGAVVSIGPTGHLCTYRNLIRPEDIPGTPQAAKKAAGKMQGDAGTPPEETEQKGLSDRVTRQLTAHRTAALQASLATRPHVALAAAVHAHLLSILGHGGGMLTVRGSRPTLKQNAPDIENSKAWKLLHEMSESITAQLPENFAHDRTELLGWLIAQSTEALLDMLAFCMAHHIDVISGNAREQMAGNSLAEFVDLDMSEWWEATADGFFNHVPRPMAVDAVKEAVGAAESAQVAGYKKGPAAELAERLLAGTRWLPEILRVTESTGGEK